MANFRAESTLLTTEDIVSIHGAHSGIHLANEEVGKKDLQEGYQFLGSGETA
jgi:hypothetical protein